MAINKQQGSSALYASKIIKAGALIGDTKTLLSHWHVAASVDENLNRLRRENVFGKASRSRVEDMLAIFRQRYLYYVAEGGWNVMGGTHFEVVAGDGFEPPTFGL